MEGSAGLPPALLRALEMQDPELAKLLAEVGGDAAGRRAVILSQLRDPALARLAFQFMQNLQKQPLTQNAQTQLLQKLKQQAEQVPQSTRQGESTGSGEATPQQDERLVKLLSTLLEDSEDGDQTTNQSSPEAEAPKQPAETSEQAQAPQAQTPQESKEAESSPNPAPLSSQTAPPEKSAQAPSAPTQSQVSEEAPAPTPPTRQEALDEPPPPLEELALATEESLEAPISDENLPLAAKETAGELPQAHPQAKGDSQVASTPSAEHQELPQSASRESPTPQQQPESEAQRPTEQTELDQLTDRPPEQELDTPRERPAELEQREIAERSSSPQREEAAHRAHDGPKRMLPPMTQPQINLLAQQLLAPALAAALARSNIRPGDVYIQSYKLPYDNAPTLYVAMDLATRFAEMSFKTEQSQESAAEFVEELLTRFPYQVRQLMSRRTQSLAALPEQCKELGVRHSFIEPNSRLYRGMNRIVVGIQNGILNELKRGGQKLERLLADYCNSYNYILPQQALSSKTPWATVVAWFSR